MTTHLFNIAGGFIALRRGRYLFNRAGKWIGWFPWDSSRAAVAVDVRGKYLGTVVEDRLLHLREHAHLSTGAYPGYAGYPGYIGQVASRGRFLAEAEQQARELQAAGVPAHTVAELYPERVHGYVDVQAARLMGQRTARVRKELGDWLGL